MPPRPRRDRGDSAPAGAGRWGRPRGPRPQPRRRRAPRAELPRQRPRPGRHERSPAWRWIDGAARPLCRRPRLRAFRRVRIARVPGSRPSRHGHAAGPLGVIPLRSRRLPVAAAAGMVGIAAAVFTFAYDHGGYAPESRDLAGVLVWAAVLFGLVAGFWRGHALPPAALVAGTCLTALAAFAGVSAAWAPSTERALDDFCRTLLYSGVFVFVSLHDYRRTRCRWLEGPEFCRLAVIAV